MEALALDDGYEPLEEARVESRDEANVAVVELGMRLEPPRAPRTTRRRRRRSARCARWSWKMRFRATAALGVLRNVDDGPPTVSEFLDVYDAALDVDLDSENVAAAAAAAVLTKVSMDRS